jgi:hypothetical protein
VHDCAARLVASYGLLWQLGHQMTIEVREKKGEKSV